MFINMEHSFNVAVGAGVSYPQVCHIHLLFTSMLITVKPLDSQNALRGAIDSINDVTKMLILVMCAWLCVNLWHSGEVLPRH